MSKDCISGCSLCCRYVAIPIDTPRSRSSIDQARWMVSHRDVWLSVDGHGEWHVQFLAPCEHLDIETNRCGIYADRFDICRKHEVKSCEATCGEGSEPYLFRTLRDLDDYLALRRAGKVKKKTKKRRGEARG